MTTRVVDLFAGPGGLGEGFSGFQEDGLPKFKIAISVEKEESAHRTLTLRAFFRQFEKGQVPDEYYEFLKGNLGNNPEDELFRISEFNEPLQNAKREAQRLTLGEDSQRTIYRKIRETLADEEFVLIGGPPCQAYSLAGRSRNYGDRKKNYSAVADNRNFLYLEYLKIIAKFQPAVFVMENVKGMLSARIDGRLIFDSILKDLGNPGRACNVKPDKGGSSSKYRIYSFVHSRDSEDLFAKGQEVIKPKDYLIRAEDYGVPQSRHRVILLGVREDIGFINEETQLLKPSRHITNTREVISDLPKLRSKLSKGEDSLENWRSVLDGFSSSALQKLEKDKSIPSAVLESIVYQLESVKYSPVSVGADKGVKKENKKLDSRLDKPLCDWFKDEKLDVYVINHEARGHIKEDLHRYFFYSTFAKVRGESPTSKNLPKALWPEHKNFSTGKFADRFRVQLLNRPSTTITSHISKDGHYYIHYDPLQCRSLTVREAARIQTFPDNYYFAGNRTQQYVQVGNAVPPYLAMQLARVVFNILNT